MKTSEVLRKAAKILEHQMIEISYFRNAGCSAINKAINDDSNYDLQDKAADLLRLVASVYGCDDGYWFGDKYNDDDQNHRIVALCLAAAIAESEGD